jgi:hypothetical protein
VSQLLDLTFGDAEELMVAWLRSARGRPTAPAR